MGQNGIKRVFQTKLEDVCSSDLEGVGTSRFEGNDEYVFLQGVASTVVGSAVVVEYDYTTTLLTRDEGQYPRKIAVAMGITVASKFGWYQVKGIGSVWAAASCAAERQLYTDTSTTGGVDGTSASEHAIHGLILTAACGASAAATACQMDYPWTAPTFD